MFFFIVYMPYTIKMLGIGEKIYKIISVTFYIYKTIIDLFFQSSHKIYKINHLYSKIYIRNIFCKLFLSKHDIMEIK